MNVSAPNTFLMLERTYAAIQKAIDKGLTTVTPELVFESKPRL